MNAEKSTVFAWFKEFTAKITGKKEPEITEPVNTEPPSTEPVDTEHSIANPVINEVVIRDMEEVRQVLDDLTNQVTERDQKITDLTNKITTLENDIARLKAGPTATKEKEDPFLEKSNLKTNEESAEKNAKQLKS
jgi:SMC interacting uncharacterized protein involved in chromosome segregation